MHTTTPSQWRAINCSPIDLFGHRQEGAGTLLSLLLLLWPRPWLMVESDAGSLYSMLWLTCPCFPNLPIRHLWLSWLTASKKWDFFLCPTYKNGVKFQKGPYHWDHLSFSVLILSLYCWADCSGVSVCDWRWGDNASGRTPSCPPGKGQGCSRSSATLLLWTGQIQVPRYQSMPPDPWWSAWTQGLPEVSHYNQAGTSDIRIIKTFSLSACG